VVGLGILQCLLEVTPERRQTHYLAVYTMLASCATASAPLLGTFLLSTIGMTRTFQLAAVFVALGGALIALVGVRSAWGGRRGRGNRAANPEAAASSRSLPSPRRTDAG